MRFGKDRKDMACYDFGWNGYVLGYTRIVLLGYSHLGGNRIDLMTLFLGFVLPL
jgi:hypothetical protein